MSMSKGEYVASLHLLPRTIAIDGPAGSGKSSVSFVLARELNYLFVDTGAFYRAVTMAALRVGMVEADETTIAGIAEQSILEVTPELYADGREYTLLLNGEDVTWAIRDARVERYVSRIAAIGGVRDVLNNKYRELAERGNVIMAGRDIGTVVLPDADLKIYLDASTEARAKRRYQQRVAAGESADYSDILEAMLKRDSHDSQRTVAPLTKADDAHYIDTDSLSVDSVIAQIRTIIHQWQPKQHT